MPLSHLRGMVTIQIPATTWDVLVGLVGSPSPYELSACLVAAVEMLRRERCLDSLNTGYAAWRAQCLEREAAPIANHPHDAMSG